MSATLDSTPLRRSNLLRVWRAMTWAREVLPGAGRTVENEGLNAVGLDGAPQELARAEDVGLAGEFAQGRAGASARRAARAGQGGRGGFGRAGFRRRRPANKSFPDMTPS